jgi:hypothetical protein
MTVGSSFLAEDSLHRFLLPNKAFADTEPSPAYLSLPYFSLIGINSNKKMKYLHNEHYKTLMKNLKRIQMGKCPVFVD